MTRVRSAQVAVSLLLMGGVIAASGCRNVNVLSRDEQIRIGREASVELENRFPVSRNPADIALVEGIGQRLVAANNLNWPFTFKVLEDRMVNAVSLPGGPVYIFRGLLDLTEGNIDELAAVIGHEIAHIEHQHVAKMYSQGLFAELLITFGTGGTVQNVAQILNLFLQMRFSREDEYQSDSSGIRYTYQAGYDPNGLISFFRKLERLEQQGRGDIITNNLRTHPLTAARIERAQAEIARIVREVNEEAEAAYVINK